MGALMDVARRALAIATAACVALGAAPAARAQGAGPALVAQAPATVRLAGADRYATMAAIVREAFPSASEWAVVATGEGFADALCASALAGARRCPVVLTARAALPQAAMSELRRLSVGRAYIVGGTGAVSASVESELSRMGILVTRIAGADRYATSAAVAREVRAISGHRSLAVATGASFADALSLGPWCYATASPVLCVPQGGELSGATLSEATSGGYASAVVAGGPNAVSRSVESQLKGMSVERIAGADRYATSARVAQWSCAHGLTWSRPAVATGRNFPDALAGAALQGTRACPLLLVDASSDPTVALLRADGARASSVSVLGGTGAVSEALASSLFSSQDPSARARVVADTLIGDTWDKATFTYVYADVYGGSEAELLLACESPRNGRHGFVIYTFEGGTKKLYSESRGLADASYDFYKETSSFISYGHGHGSEWYFAHTMSGGTYIQSASMTRNPAIKGGGASDGPWKYSLEATGECDKAIYDTVVGPLTKGRPVHIERDDRWAAVYG